MRSWTLARWPFVCGLCGLVYPTGTPAQLVTWSSLRRPKLRCQKCAEGTAPVDLVPQAVMEKMGAAARKFDFMPLRSIVEDFKRRQAGEREPGEDDA